MFRVVGCRSVIAIDDDFTYTSTPLCCTLAPRLRSVLSSRHLKLLLVSAAKMQQQLSRHCAVAEQRSVGSITRQLADTWLYILSW